MRGITASNEAKIDSSKKINKRQSGNIFDKPAE